MENVEGLMCRKEFEEMKRAQEKNHVFWMESKMMKLLKTTALLFEVIKEVHEGRRLGYIKMLGKSKAIYDRAEELLV